MYGAHLRTTGGDDPNHRSGPVPGDDPIADRDDAHGHRSPGKEMAGRTDPLGGVGTAPLPGFDSSTRQEPGAKPETGAASLAFGMELWRFTFEFLKTNKDKNGVKLWGSARQGVTFPMADAFSWLAASYYQILDVLELAEKGPLNPAIAEGLEGTLTFFSDLCFIQAVRAVGECSRICTELFYGYNVEGQDDTEFIDLKKRAEKSAAGVGFAKQRAGTALTQVMIPEALDYPL